ncbi:MAG: ribose-5-phosphate isomerase RpiA [Phototrophicaceae bacterium]
MDVEALKRQAGESAVDAIESGMVVGLGTGSTAIWAVRRLAYRIKAGDVQNIRGVPTSRRTEEEARQLGIPLVGFDEISVIDLTIDGADEIDPQLNLIKGGGGALLREKIIAQVSRRMIVVADARKRVPHLGTTFMLPVETVMFGHLSQRRYLESLGAQVSMRLQDNGQAFITDNGNLIYDCNFGAIADPYALARKLEQRAGIVEHGLFLGMATEVILATATTIETLNKP